MGRGGGGRGEIRRSSESFVSRKDTKIAPAMAERGGETERDDKLPVPSPSAAPRRSFSRSFRFHGSDFHGIFNGRACLPPRRICPIGSDSRSTSTCSLQSRSTAAFATPVASRFAERSLTWALPPILFTEPSSQRRYSSVCRFFSSDSLCQRIFTRQLYRAPSHCRWNVDYIGSRTREWEQIELTCIYV